MQSCERETVQHSNGTGMLPGADVVNDDDCDDCFPPNEIICLLKLYKLLAAGIFFKALTLSQ